MPVSLPEWPTPKQEGWTYTNLKALTGLELAAGQTLLENTPLTAGLSLTHWEGTPARLPDNGAVKRALASADAGWRLDVKGQIEAPFELTFGGVGVSTAPRLSIALAPYAELTLIERHHQSEPTLTNMVGEIVLAEGAKLTHIRLQQCGDGVTHLDTRSITLAPNATYNGFVLVQGAALSRYEPHIQLEGAGAEATLNGLLLLSGTQHGDLTSHLVHAQPRGNSHQSVRAIISGQARGTYQGRIVVAPHARLSDAQQLSRTLLLSPQAEMNAKPELEILNDDVKCSHGASIGAIDPNALFYLRSRGLDEQSARSLLVDAFVAESLTPLPPSVLPLVQTEVTRWLEAQHG